MPFLRSRFALPIGLFLLYMIVVVIVGYVLFYWSNLGTETTTTNQRDSAADALYVKSIQTKTSVPVLTIYTVLAAGGWLIIPLKFFWDELAKKADDIRGTNSKMRDLIYKVLEEHHGPLILRCRDVTFWATSCKQATASGKTAPYERLFYAVARLCDSHELLRVNGVMFILRSRQAEKTASQTNRKLAAHVRFLLGDHGGEDLVLRQAVLAGATTVAGADRFIPFDIFETRLASGSVRTIYVQFLGRCAQQDHLKQLISLSMSLRDNLAQSYTDVYQEWYSSNP